MKLIDSCNEEIVVEYIVAYTAAKFVYFAQEIQNNNITTLTVKFTGYSKREYCWFY